MAYLWTHPTRGPVLVGDRDEAAAVCKRPMKGKTLAKYSRVPAKLHPCPKPVTVDLATGRHQWILGDIARWDAERPGRGDHGGKGYHHRVTAHVRDIGDATIDEAIAAARNAS